MAKKFLYLYSRGQPPKSPEEGKAMMDAWMAWFDKVGPSVVDGGAPFASGAKILGTATASGAGGYTILAAEGPADAVAMADGHPHFASGGGIEVFEIDPMPGM